jgi:hypothetical protein
MRKILGFLFSVLLIIGCSKTSKPVEAPAPPPPDELKVEYGFDEDKFVVHNIMDYPLNNVMISLDIFKGNNAYSTLMSRIEVLEPDGRFYPQWTELKDGKITEGITFPQDAGISIKNFSLSCDEGDIWEEET